MGRIIKTDDEEHLKRLEYYREYRDKNREKRREQNRKRIEDNREKYNAQKAIYRDKIKKEVFTYYGKGIIKCVNCGFDNLDALCLDHIDNNGAEHRKQMGVKRRAGINTYEVLKKQGYPSGIQILCANCNLIKEIELKRQKRLENIFYNNFYYGNRDTI